MDREWHTMASAPRDGSMVDLTWMEDGEPQEIWPMRWDADATNPLVQAGKGIWAIHSLDGNIEMTWSEENPDGSPTHWRHHYQS